MEANTGYTEVTQHSEDHPPQASARALRVGLLVLLAGACAAGAATALLEHGRPRRGPRAPSTDVQALMKAYQEGSFQGRCGLVEQGIDYELDYLDQEKFGMSLDHIPSADMCCAMCQGVPECVSWTWVANALPDGCHGQCWLKGGVPKVKRQKLGVTSGLPPPRPPLDVNSVAAAKQATGGGTCFCWSLMLPFGYEIELLKFQYGIQGSIFACDAAAVYSNRSLTVAPGLETSVVPVDLTVKFGGDSYSALNTWIFIAIWKKVIDEGWHKQYAWIVKVDPDAVFFVDRLRPILAANLGAGYINNCRFGLHGPIEVLAANTLSTFEADYASSWDGKAPDKCVKQLHFGQWGEDFFLSQCMKKVYNIYPKLDENLMCEAHCSCPSWYWCADGTQRVTYHPFKRVDMYSQCMANALSGQRITFG